MKNILIIMFLSLTLGVSAQELYRISQYSSNQALLSTSITSFSEGVNIGVLGRKQWSNISGAPTTGLLSASSCINGSRIHVSGFILADKVSIYDRTVINVGVAYKLPINSNNHISIGINGGFNADKVDLSRANYNQGDNTIQYSLLNEVNGLAGAGLAYGNTKIKLTVSSGIQDALEKKNIYAYANKIWGLNVIDLHTSVLYKNSLNTKRDQIDINALAMYKKTFGLGIGYRLNNELVFMGRISLKEKYHIGYAYDFGLGKLSGYNGHEIYLRLQIPTKSKTLLRGSGYTNPLI